MEVETWTPCSAPRGQSISRWFSPSDTRIAPSPRKANPQGWSNLRGSHRGEDGNRDGSLNASFGLTFADQGKRPGSGHCAGASTRNQRFARKHRSPGTHPARSPDALQPRPPPRWHQDATVPHPGTLFPFPLPAGDKNQPGLYCDVLKVPYSTLPHPFVTGMVPRTRFLPSFVALFCSGAQVLAVQCGGSANP